MSTNETKKKNKNKKKCDKKRKKVADASDKVTKRKKLKRKNRSAEKLKAQKRDQQLKSSSNCEENAKTQKQEKKDKKSISGSRKLKQSAKTRVQIKNSDKNTSATSLDTAKSDIVVPNKPTSPYVLSVATAQLGGPQSIGAQKQALRRACQASGGKVFIKGLRLEATEEEIEAWFQHEDQNCGRIADTYWMMDRKKHSFRGMGFITFDDVSAAVRACKLHGQTHLTCPVAAVPSEQLALAVAHPFGGKSPPTAHIPISQAKGANTEPPKGYLEVVPAKPMKSWCGEMHSGKTKMVYCRNLSYEIEDEDLVTFFKTHCPRAVVQKIAWLEDDAGTFNGSCVVTFATATGASAAIKQSDKTCLGRQIVIRPSKAKRASSSDAQKKWRVKEICFVGNLSFDVTEEALREFAGGDDAVKSVRWLEFEDTGKFKGCGFVQFHTVAQADAFVECNGKEFCDRAIQIDYSQPVAANAETSY